MNTRQAKDSLIQRADCITAFIERVCSGLVLAYIISAFGHPLPDAVLYSAVGLMLVAAWIPVYARRGKVQEESR
jgi:hypothetical protein